jgi:hypothetical protein
LRRRLTIYVSDAGDPNCGSEAILIREPDAGSDRPETAGFKYLLEVYLAKEAIEVWREWRDNRVQSIEDRCAAVIHYATTDAYLPL